MTPQWLGSPLFGHRTFPLEDSHTIRTVRDAVGVSAAAIDAESVEGMERRFYDFAGHDLGTEIDWNNIEVPGNVTGYLGMFPVAADEEPYSKPGWDRVSRLYLTDGGHSDNLAAYALVRRLCQHITIADAEYDPFYGFEGYVLLKERLKQEMAVNLEIPFIDSILRRDERDNGITWSRQGPFDGSKPIMTGTIGPFAWWKNDRDTHYLSLDVTYIKMSVDEHILCRKELGQEYAEKWYTEDLVRFYSSTRNWLKDDSGVSCQTPFPQYPTTWQIFDSDRAKAYMDLGYRTIMKYLGD